MGHRIKKIRWITSVTSCTVMSSANVGQNVTEWGTSSTRNNKVNEPYPDIDI